MTGTSAELADGSADGWPSTAEELRSLPIPWGTMLATGLLGIAFGAAMLVWPDITLRMMAAIAAVWLLLAGVARLISAFLPGGGGIVAHVLSAIVGVVVLIAGLICLSDLISRLAVLALMFAITWVLSGIAEVAVGLQHTGAARVGLVGVGLLSVTAGIVFVAAPEVSLTTLVYLTATCSLLVGLAEVVLALVLRRTRRLSAR